MTANPTLLSMPLAQNGQKNVIPETQATAGDGLFSQSTGFPAETSLPLGAGGVAPSREDFNGLANLLGGVAFYAQKGWQFQFDAGQDYYAGCIVRDTTDGKLYECLNDVAAGGSAPSADAVNWIEYGVDPSMFANPDLSNLTATGEARFAHVIVDSYYDSTTGDWWRQYADGWIEQGGAISKSGFVAISGTSSYLYALTLLKPFANSKFFFCGSINVTNLDSTDYTISTRSKTSTSVDVLHWEYNPNGNFDYVVWVAFGMGANS